MEKELGEKIFEHDKEIDEIYKNNEYNEILKKEYYKLLKDYDNNIKNENDRLKKDYKILRNINRGKLTEDKKAQEYNKLIEDYDKLNEELSKANKETQLNDEI